VPLPFIHSTTSLFGLAYTGFRGLILAGAWNNSTAITTPRPVPSGIALVQSGDACSTAGVASQVLSTVAGTVPKVNFLYIPQTTGLWSVTATTAADPLVQPPMSGMGAAVAWNSSSRTFMVWSSVHDWVQQLSSVGGGYFTSS
jgi:hypothetical protein